MAVGAAALVLILSVYNGFDRLIEENISDLTPDILIRPAEGKYFVPEGEAFDAILEDGRIGTVCSILEENVFLSYDGKQGVAKAKGVDEVYEQESALAEHVTEGEFTLRSGELKQAAVGAGLAYELGIHTSFLALLEVYYPQKNASISLTRAVSSLNGIKVKPSSLFSISTDIDNSLVILPIESMRGLLGLEDEISAVEIRLRDGINPARMTRELQKSLGPEFDVLDRYRQNTSLYRMMRYEKLAIFMILIFVVIIIAFNIFGSLSMLIIEKKEDMESLRAMGASDRLVRRIFVYEGWLVSLVGLAAGLLVGIILALVQQRFGIIKMPGGFLLQAYPVVLKVGDVILTAAGVALIGLLISLLAARKQD